MGNKHVTAPASCAKRKSIMSNYATCLRKVILERAENFVSNHNLEAHTYRSRGKPPTVLFRRYESDGASRHGNFHQSSFACIAKRDDWSDRLEKKVHSQRHALDEADRAEARELDSCTSSDALLMNIFCHPSSLENNQLARLFGFEELASPKFGYKPGLARGPKHRDGTEIDMKLCWSGRTVLAESKLTERDFTTCDKLRIECYDGFKEVFSPPALSEKTDKYLHYQLLRNILAAHHCRASFYLLCDHRRPDLQKALSDVCAAIAIPELRARCSMITWKQIAATLPEELREFLSEKYGIS